MADSASVETWRCAVCGTTREEEVARRFRAGERVLKRTAVTCGRAECRRELKVRRDRAAAPKPPGPPPNWRCAVCGCDAKAANRARARRGLGDLHKDAVTCGSPECRWERERQVIREAYGASGPAAADWTCKVCGVGLETANARRKARGLAAVNARLRTCSPECARTLLGRRKGTPA